MLACEDDDDRDVVGVRIVCTLSWNSWTGATSCSAFNKKADSRNPLPCQCHLAVDGCTENTQRVQTFASGATDNRATVTIHMM